MTVYALRVLGMAEIRLPADEAPRLGPGKPLAVLTYVMTAPGQCATREQIIDLLWSDVEADAARHTLRQTLWYIKRRLGDDPFATSGDLLRLSLPVSCDRDEFLAALDAGDAERAVQLYTGDFFPGFATPGGVGFEQWADIERTRLRSLFVGAAGRVVRARLETGRAREALQVARSARDLTTGTQATWRMVLECHLADNDVLGAKVELERLQQSLAADEMELEPATLALVRLIENGRPNGGASPHHSERVDNNGLVGELVGREQAFSQLVRAYEVAAQGSPQHVHITAPAGLGKTRLLEGLSARLRAQRGQKARIVAIRATPAERALPYAFAAQLVGTLCRMRGAAAVSPDTASTLVALAPGASAYLNAQPDPSIGDDALRRRALAVSELVAAVADDTPVALLIDDVHWMDGPSRSLIAALAERAEQSRLLLVTAGRPSDRFIELAPRVRLLTLDPLTADEIGALIMSIARLPADTWAEQLPLQLRAASSGSPLLVLETLQLAIERALLVLRDGQWRCADGEALAAALGAGRAMQQRLAALPPAARDTLLRLSVAGAPIADDELELVLTTDGRESLAVLEQRGFVLRTDGTTRPAHDEIAAMTVDLSSTGDRTHAHTVVAEWLERTAGDDLSRLARAGWHRWRVKDTPRLDRGFARLVERSRVSGDRLAVRALAQETLGPDASDDDVRALVARLPRRLTVRRRVVLGVASITVLSMLALVAFMNRPAPPPPDARLTLQAIDEQGELHWVSVSIDEADLASPEPINAVPIAPPVPSRIHSNGFTQEAHDGMLYGSTTDTVVRANAVDLIRLTPMGRLDTLLVLPYDQVGPFLSPDERLLAFDDRRGSPMQDAHVAVLTLGTDSVRALSGGNYHDDVGGWSPDGTHVGAIRTFPGENDPQQFCAIAADGAGHRCYPLPSAWVFSSMLAWRTARTVLLQAELESGAGAVVSLDLADRRATAIDSGSAMYTASPNGNVILCKCRLEGVAQPVLALFDPDRPASKRPVRIGARLLRDVAGANYYWRVRTRAVSSVAVLAPDTVAVGGQSRLRFEGRDTSGSVFATPYVRWTSLQPSLATVDSNGLVTARQIGRVGIVGAMSDRMADTAWLTVVPFSVTTLQTEAWYTGWQQRWLPFGTPAPTVTAGVKNTTLHMNGDDYLTSGVISWQQFDARQGLGARMRFRLPISRPKWQSLNFALDPVADSAALAAWSGRTQGLQLDVWSWRPARQCSLNMPRREGGPLRKRLAMLAATHPIAQRAEPPTFSDGEWHTAELQVHPDGRCAVVLDGVLLGISTESVLLDRPLRVMLHGAAVDTDVEVGAVTVWRGVRTDGPLGPLARTGM